MNNDDGWVIIWRLNHRWQRPKKTNVIQTCDRFATVEEQYRKIPTPIQKVAMDVVIR